MRRSFIEWLTRYVANTGVLGLVEGALGIMALGGSLSALLGDAAIKAAAIVAVILSTLGLVILLVAGQTRWQRESELGRRLIAQYCNILMETRASYFKVVDWKQVMTVKSNGDLFSSITLRSVAVCEDLRFFRFRTGPAWGQPAKHRKGVTVQVRSVISGEIGGHTGAARRRIPCGDGVLLAAAGPAADCRPGAGRLHGDADLPRPSAALLDHAAAQACGRSTTGSACGWTSGEELGQAVGLLGDLSAFGAGEGA